jgi:tRNA modification GTPase
MNYATDDTIAAIASAPGGALRGIIRVSGPRMTECLDRCFTADTSVDPKLTGRPHWLDGQLAVGHTSMACRAYLWPTTRSYTGQPTVELHTIGSPPLLDLALATLCENGARLAGPGEFTLRAFLSGRIDLPKAEAVLAVIDAHEDRHLRTALAQLAGGLSQPLNDLRNELLDLLAELEAGLDFVEEDIEFISDDELRRQLAKVQSMTESLIDTTAERSVDRQRFRIVLVGAPNVGKSSLLNALTDRSTAIVSDQAGTTRDYVDAVIDLDGFVCSIVDTAGIERKEVLMGLDQQAQATTVEQVRQADLCLVCLDASRPLEEASHQIVREYGDRQNALIVLTKADLPRRISWSPWAASSIDTSSRTGIGMNALRDAMRQRLVGDQGGDLMVASTALRCHDSLRSTVDALTRALTLVETQAGNELVAAELRVALDELGKVVGATYTDDILDRIFGRFCIGK